MILLAIALLTILAGTLLLAKSKKEMPGKFFAFVSWFFIVVGFVLFIGFIGGGICKWNHQGFHFQKNGQQEMMMKQCGPGMPGGVCCPQGMGNKMMCPKHEGMPNDSMMKCCPRHMNCQKRMEGCPGRMGGDTTKVPPPGK